MFPMYAPYERFANYHKATLESFKTMAYVALAGLERLTGLNFDAASRLLEDGICNTRILLDAKALQGPLGAQIRRVRPVHKQIAVYPRATTSLTNPEAAIPVNDLDGWRVLFVEDHPLNQKLILEMLEDLGCEVDAASNGAEAVECAGARSYDLILMDMRMPKMDGLAATRAIRALPGYRDTPILSMTASALVEDHQRCLEAGMDAHLGKPVTPATLAAALGQWLPNMAAVPGDSTPACDNDLSRALASIPGFDVRKVLQRSPEQLADYCALLNRFVKLHGRDMVLLREHLEAGEYDAAHDVVHKLKGISGLIGVPRIESLADEIAQRLRSGVNQAGIESLASKCEAELVSLLEAVRALPVLRGKQAAT